MSKAFPVANDVAEKEELTPTDISPLSKEIVVGVVAYAGAGSSTAASRLELILHASGYEVHVVKLSELIEAHFVDRDVPKVDKGPQQGKSKLNRAMYLQNLGDEIRESDGDYALASLAISRIMQLRGGRKSGDSKIAYIVETIKHREEVEMLRRVYDQSFRLVAVHCDRPTRIKRLVGKSTDMVKYAGAQNSDVMSFVDRDEKDGKNKHGQQVRDAFYLADYFVDNSENSSTGEHLTSDITRFSQLLLGTQLVRPTLPERAMYHAHAAALQSSCLSRQVGAALVSLGGEVVSTGANDVPRYGGGVYQEGAEPDHRCHAWNWTDGEMKFVGCHNDRRKQGLRQEIGAWFADTFSEKLAEIAHPDTGLNAFASSSVRVAAAERIRNYLLSSSEKYSEIPGIKDLIEYSRAIHAEMDALFSAAREGISPVGGTLYCTTYPCHSCARHLVTAGVSKVYFIEPYVKSLATELHYDSIGTVPLPSGALPSAQKEMLVVPFTGVGPRMYEDFFSVRGKLKGPGGVYQRPADNVPSYAVRLLQLGTVEESAAGLVTRS
ncbi:hypothetical protein D3C80_733360 [compost metagenome]